MSSGNSWLQKGSEILSNPGLILGEPRLLLTVTLCVLVNSVYLTRPEQERKYQPYVVFLIFVSTSYVFGTFKRLQSQNKGEPQLEFTCSLKISDTEIKKDTTKSGKQPEFQNGESSASNDDCGSGDRTREKSLTTSDAATAPEKPDWNPIHGYLSWPVGFGKGSSLPFKSLGSDLGLV